MFYSVNSWWSHHCLMHSRKLSNIFVWWALRWGTAWEHELPRGFWCIPCSQFTIPNSTGKAPISPLLPFPLLSFKTKCYIYTASHQPTQFNPEDGNDIYIWNSGNVTHNHMVYQPKNRIIINNQLSWKPKISNAKTVALILVPTC